MVVHRLFNEHEEDCRTVGGSLSVQGVNVVERGPKSPASFHIINSPRKLQERKKKKKIYTLTPCCYIQQMQTIQTDADSR